MTAGYSGKPLEAKLGLKAGMKLYVENAPDVVNLGDHPRSVRLPKTADVIVVFAADSSALQRRLSTLVAHTAVNGMVWVCWPKRSAQKAAGIASDLDENVVREIGLAAGVVDVKVAAVDEIWSALKFVRRLRDR